MNDYYGQLEKTASLNSAIAVPRQISLLEQMHGQLEDARKNVVRLERLIELLERNHETQEILQLMGRY